ncbi:MAG: hypothetical protein GXN95_05825 [Methanococci archaeon]|uniref:Uncharacterized protein n=1 Tax=Methanocaldococcus vulcanius (strain ATCC 700851 / DSM 12094 / M7) TaxID=579137 RepID=C9RFH0_METVM|nr:hypothetical protein [Methanocaldococcus vulcanius]ACX72322.1 hypothetical protein Metvu_0463 [Methanocaldococcus vulcanius M7]NPA63051.1 hypothetical protein [Methanococci archaeon]
MSSANNVYGKLYTDLTKFAIVYFLALIGYFSSLFSIESLWYNLFHIRAPFLGMVLFGGFYYILWIVIAKEVCGKYYGVLTATLIACFALIASPWFGVSNPPWFGIVGLTSFIIMGYLTERYNGAVGLPVAVIINWAVFWAFNPDVFAARYSVSALVITFILSIVSGFIGDYIGRIVGRYLKNMINLEKTVPVATEQKQ